jgi:hypothetical protein
MPSSRSRASTKPFRRPVSKLFPGDDGPIFRTLRLLHARLYIDITKKPAGVTGGLDTVR